MVSNQIRIVVSSLNGFVELLMKKVTLGVVANLVASPGEGGTPVDTGWARANWVPNISSPIDKVAGSREAAEKGSLPGDQASGLAKVATSYKLATGNKIYITNNVPYILRLDQGHSRQAPSGFIRRAIKKAVTVDLRNIAVR